MGRVFFKACLFLCFLLSCLPEGAQALSYEEYPLVRLRSLDKITARTMTFDASVGSTVKFGDIFIKVQSCRKPPPVEKNEAASFLQIWQVSERENRSDWIFSGWMFSSSPALSGMDHPVYDVWVLDCLGKNPEEVPPPLPEEAEKESQESEAPGDGPVPPDQVQEPSQSPEEQKTLPAPSLEPQPEPEQKPSPVTTEEMHNEIPADDSSPSPSFEGIY